MTGQNKVETIIWMQPRDETLIDRRHLQLTGLEVPRLEAELGQNSATKQHIKHLHRSKLAATWWQKSR